MKKLLAACVCALALCAPASGATHNNAPIGDGGGGACTVAATGQRLYNTWLWGYVWAGDRWIFGYHFAYTWICDGSHWWGV